MSKHVFLADYKMANISLDVHKFQAWYLTEATASVAPGLCLGALSKVPIEIYKFLIEVPFAKEKSPCPFKYEVSGLKFVVQILPKYRFQSSLGYTFFSLSVSSSF